MRPPLVTPSLFALLLILASCGNSEPDYAPQRGSSAKSTSTSQSSSQQTPAKTEQPLPTREADSTKNPTTPTRTADRELVEDRGSRSKLGITRDMAKDVRNKIQGGQTTSPLAITSSDEDFVEVAGVRWELPDTWRLAVPQDPNIRSEVSVPSAFGTGRILFTHSEATAQQVISNWSGLMLDDIGSPARPQTQTTTRRGLTVTTSLIEGTYTGDAREQPFYAVRLIIVDLNDGTAVAGAYYGPESSLSENKARWDQFVESMSTR